MAKQTKGGTSPFGQEGTESSAEFDRIAKLANEARESERVNEALSLYQQALRLRPTWDEGWWYLGTLFYSVDRHQDALEAFRHLIASQPKHGPSWAFLGLCEAQLREYERALTDLQKARALGLGDNHLLVNVTRYNLAILLNRFARFEQAYEVLREFVREHNEEPSVIEALGLAMMRMPYLPEEVPPDKREMVLLAGRATYKMAAFGFYDADKLFQELLVRHPATPNAHYAYGVFLLTWPYPDRAVEEFRRELQVTPSHVPARLQLAHAYMGRGDYKAALLFAEEAVKLAPNLGNARYALGRALLATGEVNRAIQELEAAAKLEPEIRETHFLLARAYRQVGRKKDAARATAESTRLDRIQRKQQERPPGVAGSQARPVEPPPK